MMKIIGKDWYKLYVKKHSKQYTTKFSKRPKIGLGRGLSEFSGKQKKKISIKKLDNEALIIVFTNYHVKVGRSDAGPNFSKKSSKLGLQWKNGYPNRKRLPNIDGSKEDKYIAAAVVDKL